MVIGSANRDPAHFPEPDVFDIDRDTRGHMAFGYGVHFCIGHYVARALAQVMIEEMFARLPNLRLDPDRPPAIHGWRTAPRTPAARLGRVMEVDADAEAPVGSIAGASIDGVAYAVVHHDEGWVMFEDRCTHARCSFVHDGGEVADGTVLLCACHGSEFDLRDGSVLEGPATEPLAIVPLTADGGHLRSR